MSFRSPSSQALVLNGVQIQSSSYGKPLPIIYGTTKITGNYIWFNDFKSSPIKQNVGGCDLNWGGGITTGYNYNASWIAALCEGPIVGVNTVWIGQNIYNLSNSGLSLAPGTRPQAPWSYLTSAHPDQAIGYNGMATIMVANGALDGSANLPSNWYEVQGFFASAALGGVQDPTAVSPGVYVYDVRPCDALLDVLTNAIYGCGWPSAQIASMTSGAASFATYCTAAGITISWAIVSQKSAADHLKDILDCTNSDIIQTCDINGNALLEVVPYGDTPINANGANYIPNTTPVYSFTPDNFLGVVDRNGKATGKDAVRIKRTSLQDVYNTVPVEFLDRHALNADGTSNAYVTSVVQSSEPTDAAIRGMVIDSAKSLHMITQSQVALHVSLMKAQRNVYIRNTYEFQVGWQFILLDPMDLVNITDPKQGILNKTVRILTIDFPEEGSEDQGMTITAEEWPFGVAHAVLYNTSSSIGTNPNMNEAPGNATPLIFDAPSMIATTSPGTPEICIALAGGANWGGADIYASYDNNTFLFLGTVNNAARFGTLTAALGAFSGTNPDSADTLSVGSMTGALNSAPAAVAADGTNLCWVDGELLSFATATLTGSGAYNLTGLYRGLGGTSSLLHAIGKSFCRMDNTVFQYPVPASRVGQLIYFKFLSFNIYGNNQQDIQNVPTVTFDPSAESYPNPYGVSLSITSSMPTPP